MIRKKLAPRHIGGRWIFIGDVHGCADELEQLLDEVRPRPNDHVIFLGDLINRGPDSRQVLRMARSLHAQCILGNHEAKLLEAKLARKTESLKKDSAKTFTSLKKEDWEWISSWPHVLESKKEKLLCVHGGFGPSIPWRSQPTDTILNIQILDDKNLPAKRKQCPHGRPWAEFWSGPEFVLYGHTPRLKPLRHSNALGLDTGCVYGGHLTAWLYPEDQYISIPSKREYAGYFGGLKSL